MTSLDTKPHGSSGLVGLGEFSATRTSPAIKLAPCRNFSPCCDPLHELLGMARLTRHQLELEPVDLSFVARSITDRLRENDPQRQVDIVIAEGARAQGDRRLLEVVLQNLLGNAWKFTAWQLHARNEFGICADDGKPVFFVRDNGAGLIWLMPPSSSELSRSSTVPASSRGTASGRRDCLNALYRHGGYAASGSLPLQPAICSTLDIDCDCCFACFHRIPLPFSGRSQDHVGQGWQRRRDGHRYCLRALHGHGRGNLHTVGRKGHASCAVNVSPFGLIGISTGIVLGLPC
jgi:hypothetical protein